MILIIFGDKNTVNEKLKGGKLKFLKRWEYSKYLDCLVLRLGHVSRWGKVAKTLQIRTMAFTFIIKHMTVTNHDGDHHHNYCSQMTGYDDPNELGTCTTEQAAEGVLRWSTLSSTLSSRSS